MNIEEQGQIETISIDLYANLCILKNALKNCDDNNLEIYDLVDFVEKIYYLSLDIRNIFTNSIS